MDNPVEASEYFHYLPAWQVIVCKECQFAVWPNEVQGHLQGKQHRIAKKTARTIAEDAQSWIGVAQYSGELALPAYVHEPIPELPLYVDGLRCDFGRDECTYVCRDRKTLKWHWQTQHQWSTRSKPGKPGPTEARQIQRRYQNNVKQVYCQRFFASRHGSHYIEVRKPEDATEAQVHAETKERAWEKAWSRANDYWDLLREQVNGTIAKGEVDEANPWLKRTGWIEYLEGCERDDLLEVVQQPKVSEDDDDMNDEQRNIQAIEIAIWEAMGFVASKSQDTVAESGVMLRLEAIRTEMHQTRYHPLQPYQDEMSIVKRSRPWQQMVMFFVRTQRQHEWKSPPYRFNRRQFDAFAKLIEEAERWVSHDRASDDDEGENNGSDEDDETRSDVHISDRVHAEGGSQPNPESGPAAERQSRPFSQLEKACLKFCIELLNQTIHNREYDMALVCASAVLGVRDFGGGFHDTDLYPPILSSIIKIAHFMVVQYADEISRPIDSDALLSPCRSVCDFEDSGYESNDRSESEASDGPQSSSSSDDRRRRRSKRRDIKPRSSFEWVKKMTNEFMVRGTGSPAQWLLDLRTYGLKIHYHATTDGKVSWKDKYTLGYSSITFTMDQFRGMVHELVVAARQALLEDILFAKDRSEVPIIPWDAMFDDPTNSAVGWNFIQDQRSRLPVDGQEWLYGRIHSQTKLQDRFVRSDSAGFIDRERTRDWMRQVARFRGLLLILMHITGGQPARGPEILSVRHRNTAQGGHRNMFIEDGMVVYVTKYHKGMQMSGDVKIIHRYLPREVGELVVWYLWLALPFIQRVEALVWEKKTVSHHMWPGDADGRKWTTDRMREELQRVTKASLGHSIHVAAYREIAIAINRQWVRPATAFQQDESTENKEWNAENVMNDMADEQAAHIPHIAGSIYARDSMELTGATADRRRQFRAVSTDWHRFLGFESTAQQDDKTDWKRKRCRFENDAEVEQDERRFRLRRMNATAELQRMMRKEVSFRSAQGQAMEAIQRGDSPIVAVMPTGSGKSVLFMLSAFVEPGGVTIVVVPLTALRKDMTHRCEQLGIRWGVWDGRNHVDDASIVLATPEKAASEDFGTYIKRIKRTRRLDRIIIDECHVILNDQLDFRKHLQELGKLAIAETQMVLLTATLPPSAEGRLFQRMYWVRDEVQLIRASTVRSNIRYSIIDSRRSKAEKFAQLQEIVEKVLSDPSQPEGKVVIMCEDKTKLKAIVAAGLFQCEAFHADVPEAVKAEILSDFRAGKVRVIVATLAFGMGIDIPDIRLIVHSDNPRNMMDYGQTSGRGGRDGLVSQAVIIRGGIDFEDELVTKYMDPAETQCRRIIIDRHLDGDNTRQQCREGEVFCDWCERHTQAPESAQADDAPDIVELSKYAQAPEAVPEGEPGSEHTQAPKHIPMAKARDRTQALDNTQALDDTQARPARSKQHTPASKSARIVRPAQDTQHTQAPSTRKIVVSSEDAERSGMRREIEVQDQQRKRAETRRIDHVKSGQRTQDRVQEYLTRWKGRCVICHQAGRNEWHSITKCAYAQEVAEAEAERKMVQRNIRLGRNAGCFKCMAPRQICEQWTAEGKYPSGINNCQFYGVVIGVVCGIHFGYEEVWSEWIEKRNGDGIDVSSLAKIQEYWAKAIGEDGFEMNNLVDAFMWMVDRVEEIDCKSSGRVSVRVR